TEALATLTDIDSDGDLIPDNQEGFGDEDLDGIPDYLDATHPCNVMPEQVEDTQIFLVEGDSGVCLRKGLTVANNEMGSIQLEDTEVSIDGEYENMGGIFDFVAYGLPLAGQTYNLVLPQRLPIPEGAVYRKYRVDSGWVDFVIDSNNYYSSSPGELGFCPPPGDVSWVKGLQQGDWCVQVTIEDGGPNDDDGEANNTIIDPSGVAVPLTTNKKPVVNDQQITMGWNSSITIDVLSNATDEDGDTLTISSANVDFGDVLIESDQLVYTPAESFFGEAVIHFGVNDNNGGTAYSTVTVDVIENQAPVAVDDEVSTDDRSTIEIDVLVNDSDIDGGLLTVLNATAQYGEVIVNENNMLIYTALLGYDGVDMIDYTISDEYDSLTSGQVRVSVTAYKEVVVTNKSSGSLGCLALLLGVLAIVFRYVRTNKLSRLMTVFIPLMVISLQSQAQWELNSKLGQSTVSDSSSIKSEYPDSKISQLDDSDLSWSFGINFRFDNNLRVGVQYINMGDAGVTITSDSLIPSQNHNAVADAGPMLVDGFALESGYRFWQAKYIEGEVFAGVLSWSGDFDSEYDGNTLSTSKNGTDIYYGVAAYYPLAPNWSLGLGYQRFNLSVNDVDMFYISVNYQY
ncbi:MAG: outer membrane beta-barrel protein, partial [Alteromonadales bacterium]|nr:outer membrane beta-barrel protein [Alteromonadales bacterium]